VSLLGLFSITAGSALAAGPPVVTVNAASNLRLNTATGSGTVDKNGAANATVKIEYGKSKLYGSSITLPTVTATGAVSVSELITSLEPATTYHYRISATNSFGTTVSEDVTWEQLLRWKVKGTPISEITHEVIWADREPSWGFTGEGIMAKVSVKFTCEANAKGSEDIWAKGRLGISYKFPFKGCKFFSKGIEQKACNPASPMTVELGGLLQTTSATSVNLGPECAFGENLPLPVGYGIDPTATEVKMQNITVLGHAGTLDFKITNPEFELGGMDSGQVFGIS
jgi:hypothetical protein